MTSKELNEKAKTDYKTLEDNNYFEEICLIEDEIKNNKDPFDLAFYLGQQDKLGSLYGELENSSGELVAGLEKYIVLRELEIAKELTKNKGIFTSDGEEIKMSSTMLNSVLKNIIRAEVSELFETVLKLESKIKRVVNSIQTCRNHTYVKKTGEHSD